jgi:Integrase core domain
MVPAPAYRHVPTGTLAVLAHRLGRVWASPSTWYHLVRKFGWRRPRLRVHPAKPKVGVRTRRADEMWHIDTTVIRLLDGTKAYVHAVIDNFSRRILAWRVAETCAPVTSVAVLVEAGRGATPSETTPVVLADAGVENMNAQVDDLLGRQDRAQNRFGPMNSSQSRGDASSYSRQLAILPLTIRTMTVPWVRISYERVFPSTDLRLFVEHQMVRIHLHGAGPTGRSPEEAKQLVATPPHCPLRGRAVHGVVGEQFDRAAGVVGGPRLGQVVHELLVVTSGQVAGRTLRAVDAEPTDGTGKWEAGDQHGGGNRRH